MNKWAAIPFAAVGAVVSTIALKLFLNIPNVHILMPFVLSSAVLFGPFTGIVAGAVTRIAYDAYFAGIGPWSLITAPSFALVGALAGLCGMWKKNLTRVQMTALAAGLTIVHDGITAILFGMLFGIPLPMLIAGQIPFTINHLAGNCAFVFLLSPGLVKFMGRAEAKFPSLAQKPAPQTMQLKK